MAQPGHHHQRQGHPHHLPHLPHVLPAHGGETHHGHQRGLGELGPQGQHVGAAGLIGRALRGVRHQEHGAPPMKYHHVPYHHHADYFAHPQGGHGYPWPQPYPNPNTSRAAQHYTPA